MNKVAQIRIFIASPGDLKEERDCIENTVRKLNDDPFIQKQRIQLKIDRWENVYPQAGRPQAIINEDVYTCDLFIGMLHRRFGSPSGKAESGTYEEFTIAFERWESSGFPQIMFYFKTVGELSLEDLEDEQLKKVLQFKKMVETKRILLTGKFTGPSDFTTTIEKDLKGAIIDLYKDTSNTIDKQKSPAIEKDETDISTYLNWIELRCGQMDLQRLASQPIIVGLPELFVPLYADDPERGYERQGRGIPNPQEMEKKDYPPVDIEELVQKNDYLLIEGEPGCGKTTLLKQIALKMKRKEITAEFHLPILIFLRDCIALFKGNGNKKYSAEEILEAYFHHHGDMITCAAIKTYCERKKILFLIDGLDEVAEEIRGGIIEAFAELRLKYDIKMVLAGRQHGIVGEAMQCFGKKHVKVLPFNEGQIEQFITKWCTHIFIKRPDEGTKTASDLLRETRMHHAVKALIENPLMLTTVCILYYEGERLPEQRAELYRKFVENLIHRRFREPDRILEVLKGMAFQMQESGKKGIDRNDAIAIIKKSFVQKKEESDKDYKRYIENLFNEFEPRCGLLRLEEGHYRFWHLTFQEYLAAEYLVAGSNDLVKAIEPYLANPQYRETVRLYIGCLSLNQKTVAATIIRNVLKRDDASIHELVLVGKALVDIKKERREDQLVGEVQKRYWEVINGGTIKRNKKATLGEIIGWIGDERDLCEFIGIKGGAYDLEDIGKQVEIKPFEIGKYPVSNIWFAEFVKDKGYQKRECWSDKGWEWKEKEEILIPMYWNERKLNCPNLPVVGISWYEAEAFTRWLNASRYRGITTYRLPTEEEWQAAAEGFDKRAYPWGPSFDAEKCNCSEGEDAIDSTSSVGILPAGDTQEGVSDLAGNVWEWTTSVVGSFRVVRGGSWRFVAGLCRCANRDFRGHGDQQLVLFSR